MARARNIFGFSICISDRGCGLSSQEIARRCAMQRGAEISSRTKRRTIIDRLRRLVENPDRCVATNRHGERCRHRIAHDTPGALYCRQHAAAAAAS
jgi:hypothetical protein